MQKSVWIQFVQTYSFCVSYSGTKAYKLCEFPEVITAHITSSSSLL